ncbi:hypothetical protein ACUY2X_10195 [Corynebacterium minutissimum]
MLFTQEESAKSIAAIAVFISSEEGKAFYRRRYEVRLEQWAEETTAKRAAQNARADVFRDVQDKATSWKNPEELIGYDELQDAFTLRMFVAKDAFKVAAALAELCGVDDVLVEAALFDELNDVEETVTPPANEVVSIHDAALELGWSEEELLEQLVQDGLVLNVDGELVISPHPDISRVV